MLTRQHQITVARRGRARTSLLPRCACLASLGPARLTLSAPPCAAQAIRHSSARSKAEPDSGSTSFDPLRPSVPTDVLGLPLSPLPLSPALLSPPRATLDDATLLKLHRLSALVAPPAGSEAESRVRRQVESLVGLMDQVKAVDLGFGPGEGEQAKKRIREELVAGYWVDPGEVFDAADAELAVRGGKAAAWAPAEQEHVKVEMQGQAGSAVDEGRGRDLLKWARRTRGNHYVFPAPARQED